MNCYEAARWMHVLQLNTSKTSMVPPRPDPRRSAEQGNFTFFILRVEVKIVTNRSN